MVKRVLILHRLSPPPRSHAAQATPSTKVPPFLRAGSESEGPRLAEERKGPQAGILNCGHPVIRTLPRPARAPLSICCFSAARLCPTLCDPMDCSTPGSPVLQNLPEFAQIHVHWVGDAIQPSRPLLPPSPPAFHLSQHQGLFQ